MKNFLIAVAMSCATSTAFAADAVVYEPVDVIAAPIFSWTGGYIGLQAGYSWGDSHVQYLESGGYSDPNPDGWLGGIYLGYSYQMPSNLVLGLDADIAYTDAQGFGQGYNNTGTPTGPGSGEDVEMNWSGAVRARLGYAVDRFLPYVAGGVAFADMDITSIDGSDIFSDSDTLVGWTIGAGVEYAFTDMLIGRVEYRYTDFGSGDFSFDGYAADVDLTTSDVRFGLAWKF